MKKLLYSKKQLSANRGRAIFIREGVSDEECDTDIRKTFVYLVSRVDSVPGELAAPVLRVVKDINTVSQRECFSLKIKGVVFFKKEQYIYRVNYMHSLTVKMYWKTHVLSADPVTHA